MKYIDTSSQKTLKKGILEFLKISERELNDIFNTIYYAEKEPWEWVQEFLLEYVKDESLEYIQMFHLSRRLNGTDLRENFNLEQLLLEDTPISSFFKKYNITFEKGKDHINLFYKEKLQLLNNNTGGHNRHAISYIRERLGYNTIKDYCVNGFAFRSYIEENYYYKSLSYCPEFIQNIGKILEIRGMDEDYCKNSKYYCIEYLIPMAEVLFDVSCPPVTERGKIMFFLQQSILRLYYDWNGNSFGNDENLRLRLSDDAATRTEWFICANEI